MRKERLLYKLFLLLTLRAIFPSSGAFAGGQTVDILLTRFGSGTSVSARSNFSISINSGARITPKPGSEIILSSENNKVKLAFADNSQSPITVDSADIISDDALLELSSGPASTCYRGGISVFVNNGKLRLANKVGIEDYLLGVVPAEMPDSSPAEALKAQAVCARTYVLGNLRKHNTDNCDICDTGHCQVYAGVNGEKPNSTVAIRETEGLVLSYNNRLAQVFYSADCGGVTENYAECSGSDLYPYLRGVKDPEGIKRTEWEVKITLADLTQKLTKAGVKLAGEIKSISIERTSAAGRVRTVIAECDKGITSVTGEKLRAAMGYSSLKSNFFSLEASGTSEIIFRGKGAGHGYGLCQTGTRAMAAPPYNLNFREILSHYFSGTEVSRHLTNSMIAPEVAVAKDVKKTSEPNRRVSPTKRNKPEPGSTDIDYEFEVRVSAPGGL